MKRVRTPSAAPDPSRRVLVVDDMDDAREMYGLVLRDEGYDVVEAADGAAGIDAALAAPPDLMVFDLCMPHMDGWEAIRRLRANPRTRGVPIVVLSAFGWYPGQPEPGCDAYLVKPCSARDLIAVVECLLGRVSVPEEAPPEGL